MPQYADKTGRDILPIPDQPHRGPVTFDARTLPHRNNHTAPAKRTAECRDSPDRRYGLRYPERLWRLCRHATKDRLAKAGPRYLRTEQFVERTQKKITC